MDFRILLIFGVLIPFIVAQNAVPGMGSSSALGRSIDIVKPQLVTQSFVRQIVPMRPPAAGTSVSDNWISSWTNTKYQIPGGAYVANEPRTAITSQQEILSTYNDVVQFQKSRCTFRIALAGVFAFAYSDVSNSLMSDLNSGNYSIQAIQRQFILFSGGIWPVNSTFVSAGFTNAVNALPDTYDQTSYWNFLKTWGTHVLTHADFGGEWTYYMKVNNSIYEKYSSDYVQKQIDLSVTYHDVTVGFNYNLQRNTSSLDSQAQSYISITESWSGGGTGTFQSWWSQIQVNPYYLNPVWTPISEFVFDANKKSLLLRAVQEYTSSPQALNSSSTLSISLAALAVSLGVLLL